jgi:hypothetical protein
MPRRTTLQHTLVAALAATALAASPAVARPLDRIDRFESPTPTPHQDLRGEFPKDPGPPEVQPGQPTWPIDPKPLVRPVKAAPAADGGGVDSAWIVLGIGIAATGVVAGSVAGVTRRQRVRARRVAA